MTSTVNGEPPDMPPEVVSGSTPDTAEALARLERQVERGSLFTHTIVSQTADQLHAAEAFLYGVIDLLVTKGLATQAEVGRAAEKIRGEMEAAGQTLGPGLALRIDGDDRAKDEYIPVNCAERLPICRAVCCGLQFALTAEEIEAGQIKWDLGAPYYIRHEAHGRCHHIDPALNGCSIYAQRPSICRRYSCAQDMRIWVDFEGRVLNEAWISANLGPSQPRLVAAQMLPRAAGVLPVT